MLEINSVLEYKSLINCYRFLQGAGAIYLLSISHIGIAAVNQILPVHIWSSIIIESNKILKYKQFIFNKPEFIILNIKNIKFNFIIRKIETSIYKNNLYIKSIKVKQSYPKIVQIIFNLKKSMNLHLFKKSLITKFKNYLIINFYFKNRIISNYLLAILKDCNIINNAKYYISILRNELKLNNKKEYKKPILIMLDPGHGGEDSGATGKYLTKEKDVVLQIAYRLKTLIDHEHNMRAFMTRYKDVFIPLKVRVAKAQKYHADLFISIHANAFINDQPKGSSVFALSNKSFSTTIEYLVDIRYSTDDIGSVVDKNDSYCINNNILHIAQSMTITDSLKFGRAVLSKLAKVNKLHKNNVEQAEFMVLRVPNIPSILVEAAFISNVEEENKLRTAKFQQEIAESILAGIKSYLSNDAILTECS